MGRVYSLDLRTRSIPVILVLDEDDAEAGWWGPRPAALQPWVTAERMRLERGERDRHVRRWYVRNRGQTTVDEVIDAVGRAAARRRAPDRHRRRATANDPVAVASPAA